MDAQAIETVNKLVEISPRPKKKRFFCLDCGKDFTSRLMALRNATENQYFRCQGCGRYKVADPGMIALAVLTGQRDEVKHPRGIPRV